MISLRVEAKLKDDPSITLLVKQTQVRPSVAPLLDADIAKMGRHDCSQHQRSAQNTGALTTLRSPPFVKRLRRHDSSTSRLSARGISVEAMNVVYPGPSQKAAYVLAFQSFR